MSVRTHEPGPRAHHPALQREEGRPGGQDPGGVNPRRPDRGHRRPQGVPVVSTCTVPLFVRGEVITDDLIEFGTRLEYRFEAPDPVKHAAKLPLPSPMALADLYAV